MHHEPLAGMLLHDAERRAGDAPGNAERAGESLGEVSSSVNEGTVTGKSIVGGLIGQAAGTVNASSNQAAITADGDYLGGLMGKSSATVNNSKNTGDVVGGGDYVGGLCAVDFEERLTDTKHFAALVAAGKHKNYRLDTQGRVLLFLG
jgi:hypothetical protein